MNITLRFGIYQSYRNLKN